MKNLQRLTPHESAILRSLLQLDLRSTADVAKDAVVLKADMLNAIAGERSIQSTKLHSLMQTLGLNENWKLQRSRAYYWRSLADISPLVTILDNCCAQPDSGLGWIYEHWDADIDLGKEPRSGLYVIFNKQFTAVVQRDALKRNRGPQVYSGDILPLTPALFKNLSWSDPDGLMASRIVLPATNKERILAAFDKNIPAPSDLVDLGYMLAGRADVPVVTWKDVARLAEERGVHVEDVYKWVSQR